eukprot:Awhi_evm1s14936
MTLPPVSVARGLKIEQLFFLLYVTLGTSYRSSIVILMNVMMNIIFRWVQG